MTLPEVTFKRVPLKKVKPAPYNPREMPSEALDGLNASMQRFGCVETLVWNENTGHLVGGHQRLKVLQAHGAKDAMMAVVNLEEPEERALNIALNNPHIAGVFTDSLQTILDELQGDIGVLFTDLRLDELMEATPDPPGDLAQDEQDYSEVYQVIVDCDNEVEQERVYNELTKGGYKCRPLTL